MRRMFRREIRKTLAQDVPPVLQEANFAFSKGEYGRAGELFERIAKVADARGGRRAPLFYMQAGISRIFAGQSALGMPLLKQGLTLLAQREKFHRLARTGKRLIKDLNEGGYTKEAAEIEAWLNNSQSAMPAEALSTPEAPEKRPTLPTHCPSCGAPLRPDEIDWLDDVTAECGYCGSPVRE